MDDTKPVLSVVPSNSLRDRIVRHHDEKSLPYSEISRDSGVGKYTVRSFVKSGRMKKRTDIEKLEHYLASYEQRNVVLPSLTHQLDATAQLLRDKIAQKATGNDRGFGLVHYLTRQIQNADRDGWTDVEASSKVLQSTLEFLLDYYLLSFKDSNERLEMSMEMWLIVKEKKEGTAQ